MSSFRLVGVLFLVAQDLAHPRARPGLVRQLRLHRLRRCNVKVQYVHRPTTRCCAICAYSKPARRTTGRVCAGSRGTDGTWRRESFTARPVMRESWCVT
ncbi:hypothetical protein F4802DRAFT_474556 [Xylaria palmicola]|nr:hypothetical protein F4802DRAFT_474556 [Xylaria palmicola]